jgi:hypothetical protein
VLQDSLGPIRLLESTPLSPEQDLFLTSADVAALYPSVDIEDGMKALDWFMATHTRIISQFLHSQLIDAVNRPNISISSAVWY